MAIRVVPQPQLHAQRVPNAATAAALADSALIPAAADHRPPWYRALEIAAAALALVSLLPLFAIVAILIKFDSPGPVFFRQQRVARGGRLFTFVKFRSMMVDGNQRFPAFAPEALQRQETARLYLSHERDPRVTRFGAWLRRSSVDEIPNFIHVLTGDMALVGPRPEMPEYLNHYTAEQLAKFSVAPGITGYAQIYGRGELSFSETVDFDLAYVRDRSARLDLAILYRTVRSVLAHKGAW